jgi:hypothetical protein
MTRQEIYNRIMKMLEIEQNHLRNRYETGEISCGNYIELSSNRTEEYKEYVKELALTSDDELEDKMSFVINANLETF